jgi:energy-coupling factor transporter ATP-binding protein EcfA2
MSVTSAPPETEVRPSSPVPRPGAPPEAYPPPPTRGLAACLARLAEGVSAARRLHLPVEEAEAVHRDAEARMGYPSSVAVVALVGGTGVGKSTLLNALAGAAVSEASVRRPTTNQPVAWVPEDGVAELDGLLAWLGVEATRPHAAGELEGLAILDLPDLDSIEPEHRRRVEELLPRIDAVVWVTDPEKYRDAVLHDEFLRHWLPRLDRQLIVLNKSDRLRGDDVDVVRRDLERSLAPDLANASGRMPAVVAAAALNGRHADVRDWLAGIVDAKQVVLGRLAVSTTTTLDDLARRAGVDPDGPTSPLVEPAVRQRAIEAAGSEVLRLVDLGTARRRAVAATRAAARPQGAGPLGRITAWIDRRSGRQARVGDPGTWLRGWATRGSLAPALEPLRAASDDGLRAAPADIRPAMAGAADLARLTSRIRGSVDAAIAAEPALPPSSRWWPVIGLAQTLATLAIVFSVAWLIVAWLLRAPVDSVVVPVLGQIPAPFALLVASLVGGFLIARLLGAHAGWLGRRWARRLESRIRESVTAAIAADAFEPLDRVEAARRSLWLAARGARETCGRL